MASNAKTVQVSSGRLRAETSKPARPESFGIVADKRPTPTAEDRPPGAIEIAINRVCALVSRVEGVADAIERNADRLQGSRDGESGVAVEPDGDGQLGVLQARLYGLEAAVARAEEQVRRLESL